MLLPRLTEGILVKRYKRFLADVKFKDGKTETVHCPNPGAMTGLNTPGAKVWCSTSSNLTRKLPKTLELVNADGVLVGINTNLPNRLVKEALEAQAIPSLKNFSEIKTEYRYREGVRFDFRLRNPANDDCIYVEVKNVHLLRTKGLAEFPDSVTERGSKHLEVLTEIAKSGGKAAMIYVIQREDATRFGIAEDIDKTYGKRFKQAQSAGVLIEAWRCAISTTRIEISKAIDF